MSYTFYCWNPGPMCQDVYANKFQDEHQYHDNNMLQLSKTHGLGLLQEHFSTSDCRWYPSCFNTCEVQIWCFICYAEKLLQQTRKNSSICFNAFIWLDGCIRNSGCIYSLCRKVLSFSTVVQHKLIDFVVTLGLRWLSSHHVTKLSISQYIDYETGMMWM